MQRYIGKMLEVCRWSGQIEIAAFGKESGESLRKTGE